MIHNLRIVALLSMWLGAFGAPSARAIEFVDMVRNLGRLQGDMVRGAASARGAIVKQIEQIERTVPEMDAESWKETKNARAAAIFLLSGGAPRAIRKIADAQLFSERDVSLISGSLAHAEGRSRDASKLLSSIDPKAQPVTLGGHLALVQGGLLIGINNARAQELFDLARLLMPSSLVEEAALRRQISVVDARYASEKFLLLGRRYVAQYAKSPFARNFWNEIAATTLRLAETMEEARLDEFQSLFKDGAPSTKFEIYMAIARTAILNARIALASAQTKRAEPFAETGPARDRLKFYHAAIDALSGNFEDAATDIQQIDSKSLSRADLEMRDIVTAAMTRLQYVPDSDGAAAPAAAKQDMRDQSPGVSPIERTARQALADADAVLQRASKR